MLYIDYITDIRQGLNIGFRNQVLNVVETLADHYHHTGEPVIVQEYDLSDVGILTKRLQHPSSARHIIIGVANGGVEAFRRLPKPERHTAVLIGHEVPATVESVKDKINILAVPEHATDPELPGVCFVPTAGVAHTVTPQKVDAALAEWQSRSHAFAIATDQPAVVTMLGGTVDGKDYMDEEAEQLGHYVTAKANILGAHLFASNSPRAPQSAIATFHRTWGDAKCQGGAYFRFMKGQNETPYLALIGLVAHNPRSIMCVTGDSVSMLSEVMSQIPPEQLFIYPVSNLNPQNQAFVDWMVKTGRAGIVTYDPITRHHTEHPAPPRDVSAPPPITAAQAITAAITEQLAKRAPVRSRA